MSRGIYRGTYSSLFDDPDWQRLSAHARLVFLAARLCKDAGPAAIFRVYPEVLARQTGLTVKDVNRALTELAAPTRPWIVTDGVLLWVRNGLRHDPNVRPNNHKHLVSITRWLDGLPRTEILIKFCEYYEIVYPIDGVTQVGLQEKDIGEGEGKGLPPISPPPGDITPPVSESERQRHQDARALLDFLNRKASRHFPAVPANLRLIEARLKEFTRPQLQVMIARKVGQWGTDEKMATYLRPATLFGASKCAQYIGELPETMFSERNGHHVG